MITFNKLLNNYQVNNNLNKLFIRSLQKEIRIKLKEKQSSRKLALEYFDFFYGSTFGKEWNKMRLAMLTGSKYVALLNNYADRQNTISKMEKFVALDMFKFADMHRINTLVKENYDKNIDSVKKLNISQGLKVFCFDNEDIRRFPPPELNGSLLNYYCLDGASILPVLALDIQKDDVILDLCSSPGGKTLVMLQTMLPKKIVCKDKDLKRLERLERMLKTYINEEELNKYVQIELNIPKIDFHIEKSNMMFDKVLADVPCTNDRDSLFKESNNKFSKGRTDERVDMPKKQQELLKQAIEFCKPGGTIVYSTCSLSPIQNEGVINNVLEGYQTNKKFKLVVESLDYIKNSLDYFFEFSTSCKLGLLVVPDIKKNFGPFYVCKLSKYCK